MAISEKRRLDIRQWFEQQMSDPELADAVMEAMPPLDYDQLATKRDLGLLDSGLRGEMAGLGGELRTEMAELRTDLRTEMAELRTDLRTEMAELRTEMRGDLARIEVCIAATHVSTMKWMVATQLSTIGVLGGLIAYLH